MWQQAIGVLCGLLIGVPAGRRLPAEKPLVRPFCVWITCAYSILAGLLLASWLPEPAPGFKVMTGLAEAGTVVGLIVGWFWGLRVHSPGQAEPGAEDPHKP